MAKHQVKYPDDGFFDWYDGREPLVFAALQAAFNAGALWMARETVRTGYAYATAVEGLEAEEATPAQMYDRVTDALHNYYQQVAPGYDYN